MPNYKIGINVDADDNASADLKKVRGAADSLDDAFGKTSAGAGGLGASLIGMISPADLAIGAVTAIGAAAVATAAHAMDLASQVEGATATMSTQLNLTTEEAAGFEETMRSIYANNYGTSFDDISESLVAVEQNFARIGGTESQAQLEEITVKALSLRDAFDTGVNESTSAAATLMENFGLTSDQAFDFITAGYQRGLDSSGDFLDTIGEYAVQFKQGGADAGEFFSVLETGMAGGMLGTDKAADAFKEFGVRIIDDSKLTKDALAGIGISYDTLKQGFADGSIATVDAMQTVISKINEIEDPIERNRAGVALFGTQWEDLTDTVTSAIDTQKTKFGELEGAADSLEKQYDTNAAAYEAATRKWDNALVDVGKEFNSLQTFVLPGLALAVDAFVIPALNIFTQWLQDVKGIVEWIMSTLNSIGEFIPDFGGTSMLPQGEGASASMAATASLPVQGISLPVMTPQSASMTTLDRERQRAGDENHINVYVERGDPDVVRDAAEIGVRRAQRSRGE